MSTPRFVRTVGNIAACLAVTAGMGLVAGVAVLGPATAANASSTAGGPISRSETLARAQVMVDQHVTYTEDSCWNPITQGVEPKLCVGEAYRRDCSGLVANAWHLPVLQVGGLTTNSPVTGDYQVIPTGNDPNHPWKAVPGGLDGLQPGDAIVRTGHIELFAFWKTQSNHADGAYVYSFNNKGETVENPYAASNTGGHGFDSWSDLQTYTPIRYNNIIDSTVGSHSITVGDLNNDGKNDLIGLEPNGSIMYYPNNGAPGTVQWGTGYIVATTTGFTQIAVGDLNNDGKKDLVGLRANGDIYMYPNIGAPGSIAWGTGTLLIGQSGLTNFDIGDLDNNGKNDLVGRKPNSDIWFYQNIGAPGTVAWGTTRAVVSGISNAVISVGDLNNDGKNDLITMDTNSNITMITGTGAPGTITWGTSTAVYNGSTYDTFDVADMNNDGKNDITGRVANTGNDILNPNTGTPGTITWGPSTTLITNAPF